MAVDTSLAEKAEKAELEGLGVQTEVASIESEESLESPSWTKEEETAIRRKLDWQLVPMVTLLYLLCFLDRWTAFPATPHGALLTNAPTEPTSAMLASRAWKKTWTWLAIASTGC